MSHNLIKVEAGIEGEFEILKGTLLGEDQFPLAKDKQNWGWGTMFFTAMGMAFNIILIMQGALLILFGNNWIQSVIIMILSSLLLGLLFALNGDMGRRFGIPHTVQLRAVFGNKAGTHIIGIARAIVALFFFGIQSWIVAMSIDGIFGILSAGWSQIAQFPRLFVLFVLFSAVQYLLMFYGYKAFEFVAIWGMPLCVIVLIIALFMMRNEVGNWGPVWQQGSKFFAWGGGKQFLTGFAMLFGSWCTMIINFSDLTRVVKIDSKKIAVAGSLGYAVGMILAAIIGMTTLSLSMASGLGAEWNPVVWIVKFPNPFVALLILVLVFVAQITTNPQANMLSPAITLANLFPKKMTMKKASAIMTFVSLFTFPWVFLARQDTMMSYLSNVGAVLAGIALIMVADYWIIRKRQINFPELYNPTGIYHFWGGINWIAILAAIISVVLGAEFINYGGTFVSAISGFFSYLVLMKIFSQNLAPLKSSFSENQLVAGDNEVKFS